MSESESDSDTGPPPVDEPARWRRYYPKGKSGKDELERARDWREEHPNYYKEWVARNPDYHRKWYQRRKEKRKNAATALGVHGADQQQQGSVAEPGSPRAL
jgi:DNA-binding PadR family transcriptional regulator